jgi:molybdopterin converting factor small subunit
MQFQVAFFARYAEMFGRDHLEVSLPDQATVADLIIALRQFPGGESLPASPLVAVNLIQARPTTRLTPGDRVALLPPLAGG